MMSKVSFRSNNMYLSIITEDVGWETLWASESGLNPDLTTVLFVKVIKLLFLFGKHFGLNHIYHMNRGPQPPV